MWEIFSELLCHAKDLPSPIDKFLKIVAISNFLP